MQYILTIKMGGIVCYMNIRSLINQRNDINHPCAYCRYVMRIDSLCGKFYHKKPFDTTANTTCDLICITDMHRKFEPTHTITRKEVYISTRY